jgi:hypothetical protein
MEPQSNKFQFLDNYFIFIFGFQLIGLVTASYFKSEIASFLPAIFQNYDDAVIKIIVVSSSAVVSVKVIHSYFAKKVFDKNYDKKVSAFTKLTLISLTVLAASNVFVLIGYLSEKSLFFVMIFIILLALQFAYRPTEKMFDRIFRIK